ncbi:MAG: hypothetical protein A3F11_10565 [Gammaproteobacteria bacterium RIFCSPHIGHO2_12_FULL_37_14]|nr:MAG: hypothetical protein A3F11_10565 [Gammaproteobacteria bacterium RIFCSPHIGHO2_12_FULL_37_14]
MKIRTVPIISLLMIALNNSAIAGDAPPSSDLIAEREQVIHQYVLDLGKADYQDITSLFEKGGTVISTSRGNVDAKEFFYSFLPDVQSATTKFNQEFISRTDKDRYTARFHFTFKLKDGETGDGEYVDEFLFGSKSAKLTSVYMFENLKFNVKN